MICDTDEINKGDELEIDLEKGIVFNVTRNKEISMEPMPAIMKDILKAVSYTHLDVYKRQVTTLRAPLP